MMEKWYTIVDNSERKRIRDNAKNKFKDIVAAHEKIQAQLEAIDEDYRTRTAELDENAPAFKRITQETKQAKEKLRANDAPYVQMIEAKRQPDLNSLEAKEQAQAQAEP